MAAVLPTFPALRSVVGGPGLIDAGVARLAALPRLRELVVTERPPVSAAALRPFADHPRLTMLLINTALAGDDTAEEIGRIRTLEYLGVGLPSEAEASCRRLACFARLPRLRVLTGAGNIHSDEEAEALSRFPALESAGLHGGTDAGVRHLARLRTLRRLTLMTVPAVTDAGLVELATLPRLERLVLGTGPGVTDAGLDALVAAPSLVTLHVGLEGHPGGPRVTETGLRRFVAARGPMLEELSTPGVAVGDEFVAFLTAHVPNLTRLRLGRNPGVTDRSVPALMTLTRLRSVELYRTSVPRESKPVLEARFPHARIGLREPPRSVPPAAPKE
ncbi:hypothetical protein J0H58_11150 [bacterium]|nr:hypothetical protein [bacterium]